MSGVLLVNQFFWPDAAATAQLLTDLAEDLAADGFGVRAVAGRSTYTTTARAGDKAPPPQAVAIRRLPTLPFSRGRLRRVGSYASFLAAASPYVMAARPADVTVCLSTPPFVALLGLLAKRRKSRFVYKVEDLYPDVAIALGHLDSDSVLARWLHKLSGRLLTAADAVVALDEAMAARLRGQGAHRVEVIPNWADGDAIRPDASARQEWRTRLALDGHTVILYSGNLGLAHCFDGVATAAARLHERQERVLFLFVGSGPRLQEVWRVAAGLSNVRFLPPQPRSALNGLYNAADVHLVTLRPEVADMLWPSKYPAALAAGRPVLLVGATESEMAREIAGRRVGAVCQDEAGAVVAVIDRLVADESELSRMQRSARELFELKYSRERCTASWTTLLREVGVLRVPSQC